MEDLTPPLLKAVREVRWHIRSGKAMKEALQFYLDENHDELSQKLKRQWVIKQQGGKPARMDSYLTQAFWDLVERGLAGQPTTEALRIIEGEVETLAGAELDAHLSSLPFKMLAPLLLFQFPAYLVLLVGPMLRELSTQMGG